MHKPTPHTPDYAVCGSCGIEQHWTAFRKRSSRKTGIELTCLLCHRSANNEVYAKHRYQHTARGELSPEEWERVNQLRREWKAANPEKVLQYKRTRRAREAQAEGDFTAEDWRALLAEYGPLCMCCGTGEDLTLDHVLPLSKGGTHSLSNAAILCKRCNNVKNDKHIDYRPYIKWGPS